MEELRVEDYLANRKGPGQNAALGGFGQTQPQATPAAGGLFSTSTGTSLFGSKPPENKSLFGTTTAASKCLFVCVCVYMCVCEGMF